MSRVTTSSIATWVATLAWLAVATLVVWLAAGPLTTNDLWWHLAHGGAYLSDGLWSERDPCLATAPGGAIPHQWLFAVALHGIDSALGLHGLRVLHALAACTIVFVTWRALRDAASDVHGSSMPAAAALAASLFLVLAWYRVVQLRPELFSIAAVLLLDRWLLAPRLPSWGRVAAAVALIAVWANVHSAFLIGPLLLGAALAGVAVEGLAARAARLPGAALDAPRAARLGASLGLGLLAAVANPRGIAQHLAFLRAQGEGAIWSVADEWARFDPFAHTNLAPAVSPLAWVATDLLLVGLAVLLLAGLWRFVRTPSRETLARLDLPRAALAVAGCVALLVSIRFLWLGFFPLVYGLRALGRLPARRLVEATCAALAVGVAVAFPVKGGFEVAAAVFPRSPGEWLASPYTERRLFAEGVELLAESGVSGTIFQPYRIGGFVCQRTGGSLRSFVDGSMNFDASVARDHRNVTAHVGSAPGEEPVDVLKRRGVDFFFGVGVPVGPPRQGETEPYTTTLLERAPGWLLVSRSLRHAIYLRDTAGNADNRARLARWYAAAGVPFDARLGLDPGRVLREAPAWAETWGLAPKGWASVLDEIAARRPGRRAAALETAGLVYALTGAYEDQVANDRETLEVRPRAKAPRRRLVFGLLHLGRVAEARVQARRLLELDPHDGRSRAFASAVDAVAAAANTAERNRVLARLPLLTSRNPVRQ